MTLVRILLPFLLSMVLFSCHDRNNADACCTFVDNGPVQRDDGNGTLLIEGSTSVYFYVSDASGVPIAREWTNHPVSLPPGKYVVRVNGAVCTAEVRAGRLARCSTGTVKVAGTTNDDVLVADTAGRSLASTELGKSLSLFPGTYAVSVNNTMLRVVVKAKELTEVRTGTLLVRGGTTDHYHVLDKSNKQLNVNRLGQPLAFLPGAYPVKVNNTTLVAEILPGRVTELATGVVLIKGSTDENYYVTDTLGNALNYQSLNKAIAFFPGPVRVKVNNSVVDGSVYAGDTMEVTTGSIVLTGRGTEYFHILDETGNPLHYNSLNRTLSLFPSGYIVKMGESFRKTVVNAGEVTAMEAFGSQE